MSQNFTWLLLACFGVSLILITLSLRLLRGADPNDRISGFARFFLIALRLAIGWHCFVEGMEKFNTPGWTSETYLREATGPLKDHYRNVAGDRLIDRLTFGADGEFPDRLDREWTAY